MTQPSPGWYDAPDRPGTLRYWNGVAWTDDYAARPPAPPSGTPVVPSPASGPTTPAPAAAPAMGVPVASGPTASTAGAGPWPAPPRTFGEAIRVCFSKYAVFRGRASRSEFWWFTLAQVLAGFAWFILLAIVAVGAAGSTMMDPSLDVFSGAVAGVAILFIVGVLLFLAVILPSIAVTVRRLHDTGRSGWWMWLTIGPNIASAIFAFEPALWALASLAYVGGSIALIVFLCQQGTPGPNRFDT